MIKAPNDRVMSIIIMDMISRESRKKINNCENTKLKR